MYPLDILDIGDVLLFQVVGEITWREIVPLDRFGTMVLALVVEDVLIDGGTKGALCTTRGTLACWRCGCFGLTLLITRRQSNSPPYPRAVPKNKLCPAIIHRPCNLASPLLTFV